MSDIPDDVAELVATLSRSADDVSQRAADLIEQQVREITLLESEMAAYEEAEPDKAEIVELRKAYGIVNANNKALRERIEQLEREFENYKSWEDDVDQQIEQLQKLANITPQTVEDYMAEMGYGWKQAYWELRGSREEDV